jgi:Uma2 family endonuclease
MNQHTPGAPDSGEQRLTMSYEEYLAYGEDTTHAEWVNGEVTVFEPESTRHQEVVGFLLTLMASYNELFDLGTLLKAPFEMRLEAVNTSREPDVLFVAQEHHQRLTSERLNGPADLVVEVVSPSSLYRDRVDKFFEYQRAGVREYWLIDPRPDGQRVDAYYLTDEHTYLPIAPDEQGRYHSTVLDGFWLTGGWLWQEPLPTPLMALGEMRGVPSEMVEAFQEALGSTLDPDAER